MDDSKVFIVTNKHGYYISRAIQYVLSKQSIPSVITYKLNHRSPALHIILFSHKIKVYPKNYIIYQLEQKDISNWIDKKYETSILFSEITWDYSQSNINKFPEIIRKKMIYYPIPLIPYKSLFRYEEPPITNNILFYGALNDIRRNKLLYLQKRLYPKYFIKIIKNKYEHELFNEILRSKIVLNIHFYKGAILETCRLNEILSCNKIAISEKPDMIDKDNYNLYKDKVLFVDNMDEMYEKIISSF